MLALKFCTCFVLSYYSSVRFNFLCFDLIIIIIHSFVMFLFQNTCSQLCFRSEHLQSALFQIRTLAVSFVSDQNTSSHLCFRLKHLQSALFQIRTLAVTIVSDLISEHLQSAFFQTLLPSSRFCSARFIVRKA